MKAYPEYKPSSIDWLGEIPSHWECIKLKHIVSCNDDVLSENTPSNTEIKYVEISDVSFEEGIKNYSVVPFGDAPSRARRITKPNDVIISTVRTYLKAIAQIKEENLIVSTGFAVIRPTSINSNFLYYCLASSGFLSEVENHSTGVSYPAITATDLINLPVLVPPVAEQEMIAAYLDDVTGKVDTLIAEKTKQVEDLRSYRTSLINETVSRGLNPDAPLRHSGIDWLGNIPEHWEITKLKYVSSVQTGTTPSTSIEKYWDNPVKNWFTPGDFNTFRLLSSNRKVSEIAFTEGACRIFPKNSTLLVGIGATLGKVGISEIECSANQQVNAITFTDKIYPLYGAYYLSSCNNVLNSVSNASTLAILNQDQTKQFPIVIPPLSEQIDIAEILDEKTGKIDALIDALNKQLDELAEYKKAVISEAVTGKVDVRDWNPNN